MRKLVTIVLIGAFSIGLYGANLHRPDEVVSAVFVQQIEPQGEGITLTPGQAGTTTGLREGNSVLVDSSQNGYGMVASETNPISVNPYDHDKIIMGYRQYTDGTASGSIGMAASDDAGETWTTYSNLNFGLADAGRYPSALAAEDFPVVLWNEYGGGGGEFGGRPYYTFDLFGYGGGFWFPGVDIHSSPLSHDSWVLVPTQNVDLDGNYVMNVIASDWSGNNDRIHFRGQSDGPWDGTALPMSAPTIIAENSLDFRFEADANYTSNGNMDINDDGVGYYALTSFWGVEAEIGNHTLFIKRTNDFGATWSDWYYIADNTLNDYFWDVFPDSIDDGEGGWAHLEEGWTPFIGYDTEVTTDDDGGLHVIAPVLPSDPDGVYPYWAEENGIYHFHAEDAAFALGSGGIDVSIGFIASMQLGWQVYGDGGWQANGVTMATDLMVEDRLYMAYYTVSDTVTIGQDSYSYYDVMASVSNDNGATWDEPVNQTLTFDPDLDETYPHMNKFGVDGEVYIMYQMPDYNQQTVPDDETFAAYLNNVYFLKTRLAPASGVDVDNDLVNPVSFELRENYPNPFNPSTIIDFSIPTSGMVKLTVYDITGRAVQTLHQGFLTAGNHQYTFEGQNLASGAYFYALKSQGFQDVKKMLLVK
ncbi:MAG: T9SS type A sorting domain-containing protein [FCB group bacterium]|nr:T9SS type A sorting domain-containing protein [FCB group bacterium]MBL7028356.1 T9SS type A sorting domain-containing protein [Candidatus Neomarinimicrobiota bacterium]MBL7121299.1 T9SS type A sorting domain-containing protein [Candidatus Neomarinimicrobiota bacterium]